MGTNPAKTIDLQAVFSVLNPYKERIEPEIKNAISQFGEKNNLRDACEYALSTGGKRFRPALVYMIADALGNNKNVNASALAVELFHTASLIADDLPCMDNDDFRRGRPTVHKVYGEATALLASFALIAAGFEYIGKNSEGEKDDVCCKAVLHASKLNGIHGLIGGQFMDLYPPNLDRSKLLEIIEKKTVVLFELSFILGWLFGGGAIDKLADVQKMSLHFGAAFQILDDLDDMEKDQKAGRKANFANLFGKKEAIDEVQNHITNFIECLKKLKLSSQPLNELAGGMKVLASLF
jgi:geranylgeranyl diphosphate synthase, type II